MENQELEMTLEALTITLSDIKAELKKLNEGTNDSTTALNTDLLNKIATTIEHAKKGINAEELKKYSVAIISTMRQLQDEANESFSQFLNKEVEKLSQFVKEPSTVNNRYTVDFASSRTVIAVVLISVSLLCSLFGNYNQYQSNQKLTNSDWKYRFVKMNHGIFPNDVAHLERIFNSTDSIKRAENLKKLILDYEEKSKKQAEKLEQARLKEKEAERLKKEVEKLKEK